MESFDSTFVAAPPLDADLTDTRDVRAHRPMPQFCNPAREPARFRPLKALYHFRQLLKDKENTEEVFRIFEALPYKGFVPAARAFMESEKGRAIFDSEEFLPDILDDHAALRRTPAGSVAHAYCDFMEAEGLTAAGLVAESLKTRGNRPPFDDQIEWYGFRQRDTHDLLHVLTGYGRDALGEQCVLAFTYGQSPSLGNVFIAYAGGLNMKSRMNKAGIGKGVPVIAAITEGKRLGKACPKVSEMAIRDLLAMPLEEARAKFGIARPVQYHKAHEMLRAQGCDPYNLLAA
ncbi:Coq4 family protein [Novosphingobium tardum]|uniref:Coq4 family protein n=1 Tax=Novosphingobium tardum TaxID=1538021 RepID=A0ABV8RQA2_9SPHN